MSNQIKLKRGSGSNPGTSDLVVGEVALRTDTGQLFTKKDDGNIEEIGAQAGISDGDKGDITVSNSGATFTIDNNAVSTAKLADMPTGRILGREASGTGDPQYLTATEARSVLNVEDGATADQTASEILTLLKTVDGSGSGLVAERVTLTNQAGDSSCSVLFAQSATGDQLPHTNAKLTFDATSGTLKIGGASSIFAENNVRFKSAGDAFIDHNTTGQDIKFRVSNSSSLDTTPVTIQSDGQVNIGGMQFYSSNNVAIPVDGARFKLGANDDFGIRHDAGGPTIFDDANNQGVKFQFKELNITEYTGSTTRVKLDTNGNVAIGTSTINDDADHCKLVISGQSGNAAGVLIFQDTSNNEDGMIFADNGNLYIVADRDNTASGSSIIFRVDGSSQKMRLDSSGNLDVTGNVVASGDITISSSLPVINLTDTNNDSDYQIKNGNGDFNIKDVTNSANRLTIASDGTTTIAQNLIVGGNLTISGTTTTIDTTTLTVEDKNIELGKVSTPSDTTADGGGITLKGATDKTFNWIDSTDSWTSSEHIALPDNKKLQVGSSQDLQIYHIANTANVISGAGPLTIQSDDTTSGVSIQTATGGETMAKFIKNGSVELYEDNVLKAETTSDGFNVEGTLHANGLDMDDNHKILLGLGDDLQIYHNGHNIINGAVGQNLEIQTNAFRVRNQADSESMIVADADGSVELYYDNTKRLETKSDGARFTGHLYANDNEKIRLGTGHDLEIYHDGNHSQIQDTGTGNLQLLTSHFKVLSSDGSEEYITAVRDGAVQLYYDGSLKAETRSDGFEIKQHLTMGDSDEIRLGNSSDLKIFHDGSNSYISEQGTGALVLKSNTIDFTNAAQNEFLARFFQDGQVELYCDGNKKLNTLTNGIQVEGNVNLSAELNMTEGADAQRFIDARVGSSALTFRGTTGGDTSHQEMARFFRGGACELNHAGSKKLETTNNGIQVTGRADLSGNLIIDADSPQVRLDEADTTTSTRLLMSGGQFYLQTAASGQGTSTSAGVINLTGYNNTTASQINLKASTINLSGDLSVPANEDIRFATGTWSGNQTKIQHHANALYIVGGTSGIWFRDPDGTNRWKISDAGHLEPLANDSYDIGSSSNRIRDLYTGDLNLSNEGSGNDVDGTWGSYTIQEGEESLFLINKRNGKKYKFNLTEVS